VKMYGYLFQVFQAAAQKQAARERAAKRDRSCRESSMATARFAYEAGRARSHASKLIVSGCCLNENVLI
jgi:hypothetical protein